MKNCLIISLIYKEPYYMRVLDCIEKTAHDVVFADRKGVGNMSEAFNKAFFESNYRDYHYVWFITNIEFEPDVCNQLIWAMNRTGYAAIHPSFKSDHPHIRPIKKYDGVLEVPFIEFTAPMIRADIFSGMCLDPRMPYWGMDLDISHRFKEAGCKIGVHYGVQIHHTYLRFNNKKNRWTDERKILRAEADAGTEQRLIEKYGTTWRKILNYH